MTDAIEVRLRGQGIRPGFVRSHEIAEILAAVEDLVIAEAIRADKSIKKEDLVVGLYEIADESVGLRFRSSLGKIAVPAFLAASQAVSIGNFAALSPQSLKPLGVLANFSKRHNCVAELKIPGEALPIATITSETVIPQEPRIRGTTEIEAKIVRVGGKTPKAMLELHDGSAIYCDVPVDIAIELGHRLYTTAVFLGTATWNVNTLDLEEFKIVSFQEFPRMDIEETLGELSKIIGATFASIPDVSSFVTRIRRGEDA